MVRRAGVPCSLRQARSAAGSPDRTRFEFASAVECAERVFFQPELEVFSVECGESSLSVFPLGDRGRWLGVREGVEELVETPQTETATAGAITVTPSSGFAPGGLNHPVGMLRDFLREQELTYVNRALAQTGGDKEKAAELLGVSVATIYRKLAEEEMAAAPGNHAAAAAGATR